MHVILWLHLGILVIWAGQSLMLREPPGKKSNCELLPKGGAGGRPQNLQFKKKGSDRFLLLTDGLFEVLRA